MLLGQDVDKKQKKFQQCLNIIGGAISNFKILDIGVGNGQIAQYLAELGNEVYGVDVQTILNVENQLFHFEQVTDEHLPFGDNSFDIVISHYVIEHTLNPYLHLKEIKRVLRVGGICYFSMPNRNWPREGHTHTWFLHYFPNTIFFSLLKVFGKYEEPINLLRYGTVKKMFKKEGFSYKEYTAEIINNPNTYYINDYRIKIPKFIARFSKDNIWILEKQNY